MKKNKKIILIGLSFLVFGLVFGARAHKFYYEDICLDMGGGRNPGGHKICVIEKTKEQVKMVEATEELPPENSLEEPASEPLESPGGDSSVQEALLEAINDEYKAFTFYSKTIEKFGKVRPFINIIRAEEKHIAALETLFQKYNLKIPKNTWEEKISPAESFKASCAAGVEAEIENAKLYLQKLLPMVKDYPEITYIFTYLMNASENNHLPAFRRCD